MTQTNNRSRTMVIAALMLAVAYVLPNFTGNIPQIGSMLLPMHLPTILCGFLCGGGWGAAVGFVAPIFRSVMTGGFPPMFPTALAMAFEMAAYGFVCGFLYRRTNRGLKGIYFALICAMLCGRVVWGLVMSLLLANGEGFTAAAFVAGAFLNAIPGILLQLVAIPVIVLALQRSKLIPAAV